MNKEIVKFKNGCINIKLDKLSREIIIEDGNRDFIFNILQDADLYNVQINGYMYLHDTSTNKLYDFSICYDINTFINYILAEQSKRKLKIYPLDKPTTKDLLQDMRNGY